MDLLRQLRVAGAFGLSITVVAIIVGFVIPASGPLVDGILAPGYFLPVAYWGGVHDPLQLLLAIALNVFAYALGALLIIKLFGLLVQNG
jgi:hypothetical protein